MYSSTTADRIAKLRRARNVFLAIGEVPTFLKVSKLDARRLLEQQSSIRKVVLSREALTIYLKPYTLPE